MKVYQAIENGWPVTFTVVGEWVFVSLPSDCDFWEGPTTGHLSLLAAETLIALDSLRWYSDVLEA